MRLLFDQNLSHRLVNLLQELYPGSTHVRQRSFLRGHPPKVVWVARGNCSTEEVAAILRDRHAELLLFEQDASASFLALW